MSPPPPFVTRDGVEHRQPLFLPVYQPRSRVFQLAAWEGEPSIDGVIVNAYFLYKQRELRERLAAERSLKRFVGFDGLIATDSGAFQGLTRKLYLSNRKIVRFQDAIGSDVIAPLDQITPPGDNRAVAERKVATTEKRVAEGLGIVERGMLAGVQQGGRFRDLRRESAARLVSMGVDYLAIGSLVPFFTHNHDLSFPAAVLTDARREAGPSLPIHVYGAGDPCELPFMAACGATIFDSSSYGHYARAGFYMTPYGALSSSGPIDAGEFACQCPVCAPAPAIEAVFGDESRLARHNLWTICDTVSRLRDLVAADGALERYLEGVLELHAHWFPESRLPQSWRRFLETG